LFLIGEGAPYCGEEARGLEDRYLGVKLLSSCALSPGGRSPSSMFSIAQGPVWRVKRDVEADDGSVEGILGAGGCVGVCGCLSVPKCAARRRVYCGVNILAALPNSAGSFRLSLMSRLPNQIDNVTIHSQWLKPQKRSWLSVVVTGS